MSSRSISVFVGILVGLQAAFAFSAQAAKVGLISSEQRAEFMKRAQAWAPTQIEQKDLRLGPDDRLRTKLLGVVDCEYIPFDDKDNKKSGASAKFKCKLDSGESIKVKYGRGNSEVFGEVAASRLLWALGFPADKVYPPVAVVCRNCPKDPYASQDVRFSTVTFEDAAIERKFDGQALESEKDEGWSWKEIPALAKTSGEGAPAAHLDALTLLAVFLQHTDNKADNQRLACPDNALQVSAAGAVSCSNPVLMLQDVGSTFGPGSGGPATFLGVRAVRKLDFEGWRKRKIWHEDNSDAPAGFCRANLERALKATLPSHPLISDEGRAFLGGLLSRLSQQQLTDLFTYARVERKEKDAWVRDWVEVFQDKTRQIVEMDCFTHESAN